MTFWTICPKVIIQWGERGAITMTKEMEEWAYYAMDAIHREAQKDRDYLQLKEKWVQLSENYESFVSGLPEKERELVAQVAALPEKLRTVIHLHYYEGYTVEELAALLGVSVGAVKMRLLRGREALRREMEGAE